MDEIPRLPVRLGDFIRPSGGLYYHLRAWRYARLWQPYREQIAKWLKHWPCPTHELILIGPSAGYSLPTDWLRTFASVQAFDLDPLAPWLFGRRHQGVAVNFHKANLFWQDGRLSLAPLQKVLSDHPRAAILFCNVLGQILLEGRATEEEFSAFLHRLREALQTRSWASYHDVLTVEKGQGVDHLTDGSWTDGLHFETFQWDLSPTSQHQLKGVWNITSV